MPPRRLGLSCSPPSHCRRRLSYTQLPPRFTPLRGKRPRWFLRSVASRPKRCRRSRLQPPSTRCRCLLRCQALQRWLRPNERFPTLTLAQPWRWSSLTAGTSVTEVRAMPRPLASAAPTVSRRQRLYYPFLVGTIGGLCGLLVAMGGLRVFNQRRAREQVTRAQTQRTAAAADGTGTSSPSVGAATGSAHTAAHLPTALADAGRPSAARCAGTAGAAPKRPSLTTSFLRSCRCAAAAEIRDTVDTARPKSRWQESC
jgi:hypothetical protein